MAKVDRRKQYTRMVLKNSLIALMQEKPLVNISIKELCQQADINRSTFYAHYTDIHDLLQQIEDEIIEDLNHTLSRYSYSRMEDNYQVIEKVLEYLIDNRASCQTLFIEVGAPSFQNKVMTLAHTHFINSVKDENQQLPYNLEYLSQYIVNGSIHVIQTWMKNGLRESPREMAELVTKLANQGLSALVYN